VLGSVKTVFDIFIHLDKYMSLIIHDYGLWTYLIITVVIFCETGLVVTPFLPGDSLLFAAGAFSARGDLRLAFVYLLIAAAAIAGNVVNYQLGYFAGPKVFHKERSRLFNVEYLKKTHAFYEKYGAATIIIARFLPIIRSFAPFLAGIGRMSYIKFSAFNAVGSLAWVSLFVMGGYYFGNIPVVRQHFSMVIMAIIVISVLPSVITYLKHRKPK
jgi:membrane-associated protein